MMYDSTLSNDPGNINDCDVRPSGKLQSVSAVIFSFASDDKTSAQGCDVCC